MISGYLGGAIGLIERSRRCYSSQLNRVPFDLGLLIEPKAEDTDRADNGQQLAEDREYRDMRPGASLCRGHVTAPLR